MTKPKHDIKKTVLDALTKAEHKEGDAPEGDSILNLLVRVPSTGERKPAFALTESEWQEVAKSKGHTMGAAFVAIAKLREEHTRATLAKGPAASAEKRRIAATEKAAWRAQALDRWTDEYRNDLSQSSRKQMAESIAAGIHLGKRPAVGTIEKAIKGVKAQAKREAQK